MKKNKYSIIGSIICIAAMITVIIIHISLANDYENVIEKQALLFGLNTQMWSFGICVVAGFCSMIFCIIGLFNQEKWKYIIMNGLLNISLIPFALLPFWEWMI